MKSIIFVFLLININSFAQLTWNSEETIKCVDKLVTGFRWSQGEYKQSNYQGLQYIIKRLNNKQCNSKKLSKDSSNISRSKGCYSIQREDSNHEGSTKICSELWKYDTYNKIKYIEQVECTDGVINNIRFQPNGNYILFYGANNLNNDSDNRYKSSIYMSVGTCSIISQKNRGVILKNSND